LLRGAAGLGVHSAKPDSFLRILGSRGYAKISSPYPRRPRAGRDAVRRDDCECEVAGLRPAV